MITAAVVGALSCSLLLVVALGCTCHLHAMRMREIMGSNYVSPLSRVEQEIWARQSAPPLYDEAMETSRPYDEMVAIIEQELVNQSNSQTSGENSDVELLCDVNGGDNNEERDEELLDVSESAGTGDSNVQVTLLAGASAQWRRTKPSTSLTTTKQPIPSSDLTSAQVPSQTLDMVSQATVHVIGQSNCDENNESANCDDLLVQSDRDNDPSTDDQCFVDRTVVMDEDDPGNCSDQVLLL